MAKGKKEPSSNNDNIPFHHKDSLIPAKVIDLFSDTFQYVLASDELQAMVQIVKGELFNRNYISAFETDDKRFAYVARWSPARALAYSSLFASLAEITTLFSSINRANRVLCIGGGAASELVGMASVFAKLKLDDGASEASLHVDVIDIANWNTIVRNITNYALKKWFYDETKFTSNFIHGDVLEQSAETLNLKDQDIITLLFTTNELFTEKRAETVKLLHSLSFNCKKGALLLIAESAGSYSNITVGLKQFPVQFLIDTILVGRPNDSNGKWTIIDQSDSCWYRISDREVSYPVKLENMRFFYRLYRRN